ncbi:MAG: FapA family protein, partial [Vibrio sp.]
DLTVLDRKMTQGTLSAGSAKVGGKILCFNLGVEGDTATHVEAFARYQNYKDRLNQHKELYKQAQDTTMALVRREIELKKRPKNERSDEETQQLEQSKAQAASQMEKIKLALDTLNEEFDRQLQENTVEAKNKTFTHVTIQFGDEKVLTKREHGASIFSFNQREIKLSSRLEAEDIGI